MPRYDYICENCDGGYTFELKQSFDSEPVADCPVCGSLSKRQFSSVPIVFKGSGWYVNDYGKKSSATSSATTSDSKESSSNNGAKDSKDSKTSDSKSSKPTKSKASKSNSSSSEK
ncbi:MAG: FmdB family zinc ribbon protein [Dehalococcoidia bacterium]